MYVYQSGFVCYFRQSQTDQEDQSSNCCVKHLKYPSAVLLWTFHIPNVRVRGFVCYFRQSQTDQEDQFLLCCTKHLKRPSAVFLSFNIHDICQIFHASIFPIYYYLPDKKKIICDISSPEYGIVCICINSLGMICKFSSLNNPFLHNPLLA